MAWSLAAYVPYRDDEEAAVTAAREGIKATNAVVKVLGEAIRFRPQLQGIVDKVVNASATRAEVGITLKDAGKSWRYHILYSLLCDAVDESFQEVVERYTAFVKYVQGCGLSLLFAAPNDQ